MTSPYPCEPRTRNRHVLPLGPQVTGPVASHDDIVTVVRGEHSVRGCTGDRSAKFVVDHLPGSIEKLDRPATQGCCQRSCRSWPRSASSGGAPRPSRSLFGDGRNLQIEPRERKIELGIVVMRFETIGHADHRRSPGDLVAPANRAGEPDSKPVQRRIATVDLDRRRPGAARPPLSNSKVAPPSDVTVTGRFSTRGRASLYVPGASMSVPNFATRA